MVPEVDPDCKGKWIVGKGESELWVVLGRWFGTRNRGKWLFEVLAGTVLQYQVVTGDENPIFTLGDFSKPSHDSYKNTIKLLEGKNVVPLRSDTIRLVQNGCSFHGLRSEDPNQHLMDFLKLMNSLDLNGLTAKVPHHGLDLCIQVQIFYDHVDYTIQMAINYAAGRRHRKLRPEVAWETIEYLAQYEEEEGWNDPVILKEGSLDHENPDLEQLLGL
ncbi:hypothetical protein Tco_1173921 [Tanacetum coccineum]